MRLIDLLDIIADDNLEDGTIIKYNGKYYRYDEENNSLEDEKGYPLEKISVEKELNEEVVLYKEIKQIEQVEIGIINEKVKVLQVNERAYSYHDIIANRRKINELVRVVNKLMKE